MKVADIAQFNKEAVNILRSHNKLKLNSFEVNFRRNSLSLVYKTAPKENLLKISLHEIDEVDKEDYAKSLFLAKGCIRCLKFIIHITFLK